MIENSIREWRQTGCYQPARRSTSQPVHDILPSPTVSVSRKKQKTSHSVPPSILLIYDVMWAQTAQFLCSYSMPAFFRDALGSRGLKFA